MNLYRRIREYFNKGLGVRVWEDNLTEELMKVYPNWESVFDEEGREDLDENSIRPSLTVSKITSECVYTIVEINNGGDNEFGLARLNKGEIEFFASFKDENGLVCTNYDGQWKVNVRNGGELNEINNYGKISMISVLPYKGHKLSILLPGV